MRNTPDPREAKLPKWAQESLSGLRRELASAERRVDALRGRNPGTNTFLLDYGTLQDFTLPRNARIDFRLEVPGIQHARTAIQVYIEQTGRLRVQGDSALLVHPSASNSLTLELERYR